VVGVGVLQRRHPISKAAWDIGVRDSEKGSKTSHLASFGKAMHKTLIVEKRIPMGVLQPLAGQEGDRDLQDTSLL
jgi:hypothetical protein